MTIETIYSFIYRAGQKAKKLWQYLLQQYKKRRSLHSRPSRYSIKDRPSIHERSESIDDGSELVHWQGELNLCQRARPVLVLHERKTRVTLAASLTGKGATAIASVIMTIFKRLKPSLC